MSGPLDDQASAASREDDAASQGAEWYPLPPAVASDGRKLTKWDLRRIRTRRLILQAGRELFADQGFVAPRVEDVARAAGVSRAAFYLHFKSLEDLIQAVHLREVRWQLRRYRGLTDGILSSRRRIRGWLERFFASFRQERHYILIIYRAFSTNPENMRVVFDEHIALLGRLSRRVASLRLVDSAGEPDIERRLRMHTLLRRIDEMSLYLAFNAWTAHSDLALDQLTDDIAAFVGLDETDGAAADAS